MRIYRSQRRARGARTWLTPLAASVVAAALVVQAAAHPPTLDELLRMPFERLLQLRIGTRGDGQPALHVDSTDVTRRRSHHAR